MQLFTRLIKQVDCTGYDLNQPLGVSLQACRLSAILKFPSCALGSSRVAEVLLSLAFIPETLWSLGHYDICLPITPLLLVAATKPPTLTPPPNTHTFGSCPTQIQALLMKLFILWLWGEHRTSVGNQNLFLGNMNFELRQIPRVISQQHPIKQIPKGPAVTKVACSLDSVVPLKLEPLQYPSFKK